VSGGLVRLGPYCSIAFAVFVLTGCGAQGTTVVSVVSQDRYPVLHALVTVAGTSVRATTGVQGSTRLSGLRPGVYSLKVSAFGYYAAKPRLRLVPGQARVVTLTYRPPVGTFAWDIHGDGMYWDVGIVTRSTVRATEWDWVCSREQRTRKAVGRWLTFPGALPYAVAPDTIAPEWLRRRFPASGPPKPRGGCTGANVDRVESP